MVALVALIFRLAEQGQTTPMQANDDRAGEAKQDQGGE